jgi:esterase/lipase
MQYLEFDFGPVRDGSSPLMFFLHGFPGIRSRQNRDIAEEVARLNGGRAWVPLYRGLGQVPGEFSFEDCRRDVEDFISSTLASHLGKVYLVGHSWGGYLSLRVCATHPARIQKLVLMSPLLQFPNEEACSSLIQQTALDHSSIDIGNIDERIAEFVRLGKESPPEEWMSKLSPSLETLILQAQSDVVTPCLVAERKLGNFPTKPVYEIVDTDHSFLNLRSETAQRIARFLREGS